MASKIVYYPKSLSGGNSSDSGGSGGGGGTGDMVLDDVENIQVDNLAVFSTVGAKRLKTTTTSITDLAKANDLLTKSGGNIIGNNSSGTSLAAGLNTSFWEITLAIHWLGEMITS